MQRYTITDAIHNELTVALGDYAHRVDIRGLAADVYEYQVDTDNRSQALLDTAGFVQRIKTGDQFWEIAARNEL